MSTIAPTFATSVPAWHRGPHLYKLKTAIKTPFMEGVCRVDLEQTLVKRAGGMLALEREREGHLPIPIIHSFQLLSVYRTSVRLLSWQRRQWGL